MMPRKMARNRRIDVDSAKQWGKRRGVDRYEMQRDGERISNNYKKEEAGKYNTTIN